MSQLAPYFKTVFTALQLSHQVVHFAVGLRRMHHDVSKILRCSGDVSFDGVTLSNEGIALITAAVRRAG